MNKSLTTILVDDLIEESDSEDTDSEDDLM